MAIPYHTHSFEIPTATKEDVAAGKSDQLMVTPAGLGSAAGAEREDFATRQQGEKADTALQKANMGTLAFKSEVGVADIKATGSPTAQTVYFGDGSWRELQQMDVKSVISSLGKILVGPGLTGGGDLSADRTIAFGESTKTSLLKADTALQKADMGGLAFKSQVGVTDIKATGSPTAQTVYFGDGSWRELQQMDVKSVISSLGKILVGPGLTGGGDLSADRTIAFGESTKTSLLKADTALQKADMGGLAFKSQVGVTDIKATGSPSAKTVYFGDGSWKELPKTGGSGGISFTGRILVGPGLTGGGDLSEDRTISFDEATKASLVKANTALQKADMGGLAFKSEVAVTDIKATGSPSAKTVYFGDGSWKELPKTDGNMQMPSGTVSYFAGITPPDGWLKANGAAVSRLTYAALYNVIGTVYGAGNGSTTFNLPDLRGEFIRGADDGRGVDGGRAVGSLQGDAIRNITGKFSMAGSIENAELGFDKTSGAFYTDASEVKSLACDYYSNYGRSAPARFDASRIVPTANENRPRNIALVPIIKW